MGRRSLGAGAALLGMVAIAGVVAAPGGSAAPSTVHTADFEQGTTGWHGRGGAQASVSTTTARSGAQSLAVTGRTQAWEGPGLDARSLMPAGSYAVEAWVRLADTTPEPETDLVTLGAARTPTGGPTAYDTLAWQVAVSDSTWTEVSGAYEVGTGTSSLELYLESPDPTQAFFVDDVTITGEAAGPARPGTRADLATDFEDGAGGWRPRGDARIATTTTDADGGRASLLTTDRAQSWDGPSVDVTEGLAVGETVQVSISARLAPGQAPSSLGVSIQRDRGTTTDYDDVAGAVVTADAWTELRGTYTLGAAVDRAQLYVGGDAGVSFLVDDFVLAGSAETPVQDVPRLRDVLGADGFEHVGVAIDQRETVGRPSQLLRRHFNAITPENDGKPAEVQPVEGQFTFDDLDALLDHADATGTEVYGHVLVWHSQTPDWFFLDGTRPLTDSPADQALLRARMEAHIKAVARARRRPLPRRRQPDLGRRRGQRGHRRRRQHQPARHAGQPLVPGAR